MLVNVINDPGTFRGLRGEWDRLLEQSPARSIFLSWEWLFYWWIHFGKGKELHVILFRDEDTKQLCGIAPFCRDEVKKYNYVNIRRMKFLGVDRVGSDFLDFIILPGREAAVFAALGRHLAAHRLLWDVVEISDVDKRSTTTRHMREHLRKQFGYFERPGATCPYIRLPGDYKEYIRSLSMKMRSELRKKTRKVEENRELTIVVHSPGENLMEVFDQMFVLHDKGFRYQGCGANAESSFRGEDIRRFHYDIVPGFAAAGWLTMISLMHRMTRIGSIYAFQYKDRMFCYQTGYDRRWDRWSIGTVLLGHSIKDSIARGLAEFHFLRGKEDYKSRWTSDVNKTTSITVMNRTISGILYGSIVYGKSRLRRLVMAEE